MSQDFMIQISDRLWREAITEVNKDIETSSVDHWILQVHKRKGWGLLLAQLRNTSNTDIRQSLIRRHFGYRENGPFVGEERWTMIIGYIEDRFDEFFNKPAIRKSEAHLITHGWNGETIELHGKEAEVYHKLLMGFDDIILSEETIKQRQKDEKWANRVIQSPEDINEFLKDITIAEVTYETITAYCHRKGITYVNEVGHSKVFKELIRLAAEHDMIVPDSGYESQYKFNTNVLVEYFTSITSTINIK